MKLTLSDLRLELRPNLGYAVTSRPFRSSPEWKHLPNGTVNKGGKFSPDRRPGFAFVWHSVRERKAAVGQIEDLLGGWTIVLIHYTNETLVSY